MNYSFLRLMLVLLTIGASPLLHAQRERLTPDEIEIVEKKWPGTKKTSTGMRYIIQKEGAGESPKSGDRVGVMYIGTLLDGTKFDGRVAPEDPLSFRLGRQEVIPGWEQILPMMKLNENGWSSFPAVLLTDRAAGRRPSDATPPWFSKWNW